MDMDFGVESGHSAENLATLLGAMFDSQELSQTQKEIVFAALRCMEPMAQCDALNVVGEFNLIEAGDEVERLLAHKVAEVRVYAADALFQIDRKTFWKHFASLARDPDERVKVLVNVLAFDDSGDDRMIDALREILSSQGTSYHAGYVFLHAVTERNLHARHGEIVQMLQNMCVIFKDSDGLRRDVLKALEQPMGSGLGQA